MLNKDTFPRACRPRYTNKLLVVGFLEEHFNQFYHFFVDHRLKYVIDFGSHAPKLWSLLSKSRISQLKVPIDISFVLLIFREEDKILSLVSISESYLLFCSLKTRANLTLFFPQMLIKTLSESKYGFVANCL